jgi:hypothetical protein
MDYLNRPPNVVLNYFSSSSPLHLIIFPQIATQLLLHILGMFPFKFSFHLFSHVLVAHCCFGGFVTKNLEMTMWQHVKHKPHMKKEIVTQR